MIYQRRLEWGSGERIVNAYECIVFERMVNEVKEYWVVTSVKEDGVQGNACVIWL